MITIIFIEDRYKYYFPFFLSSSVIEKAINITVYDNLQ
jgi:hypothetical protein